MNTVLTFVGGFLREDRPQSSTRLVGIGCFVVAGLLVAVCVIGDVVYHKEVSAIVIPLIAMLLVNGGYALKIRKCPDPKPEPDLSGSGAAQ